MNIFYIDQDKIDLETAQYWHDKLNEEIGETITLPMGSHLLLNCSVEGLKTIRDLVNKAIENHE